MLISQDGLSAERLLAGLSAIAGKTMMDRMMDGMGWGMGLGSLVAVVLVALVIAALVKYVFFR